jgi:hypothetical protein
VAIAVFEVGRSEWGQEKVRTMQNAWEDKRVQWLEENPTLDGLSFHLKLAVIIIQNFKRL